MSVEWQGFLAVVSKPFTVEQLMAAMDDVLDPRSGLTRLLSLAGADLDHQKRCGAVHGHLHRVGCVREHAPPYGHPKIP